MDMKEVFEERRSVAYFDPGKAVDRSLMRKIYDLAKLAPSSYDLQPWRFIEVSGLPEKKKLRAAAHNQAKVEEAALTLILLADTQGWRRMGDVADDMIIKGYITPDTKPRIIEAAGRHYEGDIRGTHFALRNAGLFAMSFMLAAKYYGVDTHPMDGFDPDKVREAFSIPGRYIIAMLIAVGYRDMSKTLLPRLGREDLPAVCEEAYERKPCPSTA